MDKTHEASKVLQYNLNRIWTFLKDQMKVTKFLENNRNIMLHISDPSFSKSEFISFKDINGANAKIILNCKAMITNAFFKQITYILQDGISSQNDRLIKFILYPNTLDNSTLLIFEECYINGPTHDCKYNSTHGLCGNNGSFNGNGSSSNSTNEHFAQTFLDEFNEYLNTTPIFLNEYQSILINTPLKNLLKLLSNPRGLRSISHSSPKDFSSFSPCVGDKFNYISQENERKYAKIIRYEKEKGKNQWFISLNIYDETYMEIHYVISFIVLLINDNCTFLSLHHDFNSSIEQAQLDMIATAKKEFLIDFKKLCEETNTNTDDKTKN